MLGEEARSPGFAAMTQALATYRDMPQAYAAAFEVWQRHLAALVDQARAEERERIASRFDSADGDGLGSLAPVVTGLFEQVARIVRGMS